METSLILRFQDLKFENLEVSDFRNIILL